MPFKNEADESERLRGVAEMSGTSSRPEMPESCNKGEALCCYWWLALAQAEVSASLRC